MDALGKAAVLLALGLALAIRYRRFWDANHPHFNLIQWDYENLFWMFQVHNRLSQDAGWPMWDHAIGCGLSVLKDVQSMAWHPVPFLVSEVSKTLLDLHQHAQFAGVVMLALSVWGVFLCCRRIGGTFLISVLSAYVMTFLTEGPATRLEVGQWNTLAGAAVFPWLVWFALDNKTEFTVGKFGVVVGMISWVILSGPHPLNVGSLVLVGLLVLRRINAERVSRVKVWLLSGWLSAAGGAVLLCSPVWLAHVQGITESARYAVDAPFFDRPAGLTEPLDMFRLWFVPIAADPPFVECFIYAGFSITFCIIVAVMGWRNRAVYFSLALALFLLLYAMGDRAPFYAYTFRFIHAVTPSGLPLRFLMILAMLIPLALTAALSLPKEKIPSLRTLLGIALLVTIVGLLIAGKDITLLLLPLTALGICLTAFVLYQLNRIPQPFFAVLVVGAILLDCVGPSLRLSAARHPLDEARTETLRRVSWYSDIDRLSQLIHDARVPRPAFRLTTLGWNPMIPLRHLQFASGKWEPPYDRSFRPPQFLNSLMNVETYSYAYLYENYEVSDACAILQKISTAESFSPDCLLLERGANNTFETAIPPRECERIAVDPSAVRLGPDSIAITCNPMSACFLFLSECYDPDWQITVNGAAVQSIPAFHLFTAIPLHDTGVQEIQMVYRPRFMRLGRWLHYAGLAWLVIGGMVFVWRRPGHMDLHLKHHS